MSTEVSSVSFCLVQLTPGTWGKFSLTNLSGPAAGQGAPPKTDGVSPVRRWGPDHVDAEVAGREGKSPRYTLGVFSNSGPNRDQSGWGWASSLGVH